MWVIPASTNMTRYRPLERGSEDILIVDVVVFRPDRRSRKCRAALQVCMLVESMF